MEIKQNFYNTDITNPNATSVSSKVSSPWWPMSGTVFGLCAGSLANVMNNGNIMSKGSPVCAVIKSTPLLNTVNIGRQVGFKCFGAVLPVVPGAVLSSTTWISRKYYGDTQAKKELQQRVNKDLVINTITSVTSFLSVKALASLATDFDASGHVMMTICAVNGLKTLLTSDNNTTTKIIGTTLATAYLASDILVMGNTAACYHTVAEVAVGAIFAGSINQLANKVYNASVQPNVIKTTLNNAFNNVCQSTTKLVNALDFTDYIMQG